MRKLRAVALAMTGVVLAGFLTGCPLRDQNIFRLWVVNASNEFRVTSVEIQSNADDDTVEILGDGQVPVGETGVFAAVEVDDFEDEETTIVVRGVVDNSKGVFDAEASVVIDDPITLGITIPLVVTGDTSLTYDVEYYPLEANAKLQMGLTGNR